MKPILFLLGLTIYFTSCNSEVKNIRIAKEDFAGVYFFEEENYKDSLNIFLNGNYIHTIRNKADNKTLIFEQGNWKETDESHFIFDNYSYLKNTGKGIDFRPYYDVNKTIYLDMAIDGSVRYRKLN